MVNLLFLFLALVTVQVSSKCPNGWMPFDNSCYRVFETATGWPQAQFECESHAGYLAVIDHKHESDNINKLMEILNIGHNSYLWIGLADMRQEGVFEWEETKHNATFFNWANHEPNETPSSNQDCIMLDGHHGFKWDDAECTDTHAFLCERHRDTLIN